LVFWRALAQQGELLPQAFEFGLRLLAGLNLLLASSLGQKVFFAASPQPLSGEV